jgi:hypothetical protein
VLYVEFVGTWRPGPGGCRERGRDPRGGDLGWLYTVPESHRDAVQPGLRGAQIRIGKGASGMFKILHGIYFRYIIGQTTAAEILIIDDVALEVSMSQNSVSSVTWF